MNERHGILQAITAQLAPVHPDGYKFLAIAGLPALLMLYLYFPVGVILAAITGYVAYFFRDPARVVPMREGLVVSPADGRVTAVERVRPPAELGLGEEPRTRISIFLSVLDVHINRAPVAGRIKRSIYVPGAFLNAALDKASEENERRAIVIEMAGGATIACVQIAGLIARRIVTFRGEGETVGMGERYGLIRFGSRVDVYLPAGRTARVAIGQRAIGGETVLADLKSEEGERIARVV